MRIYSRKNRACATQGEIQNAVSVSRLVKDRFVFFCCKGTKMLRILCSHFGIFFIHLAYSLSNVVNDSAIGAEDDEVFAV